MYKINKTQFNAYDGINTYTNPRELYDQVESITGNNYTLTAQNTLEQNISIWLDENLSILTPNDILIEFTFDNIQLIGDNKVAFDIMAKSNQNGIRFAASDVFISYNTDAFGTNVVENEKIQASKETIIENDIYTLELTDQDESIVKFLVNAGFEPNELYPLSQITEKFLHVEIEIQNIIELASINFDGFSMDNQSFFYDVTTGEYISFDKVAVNEPFFPFLIPNIISISPNPVPAGTRLDEHILTITGDNFGDHNNNQGAFDQNCANCKVRFADSDNPMFGHVYARGSDIISWTNTEIKLHIPSATAVSGLYQNSAASGGMRVESPTGSSSEIDIHIPYSVLNFQPSPNILTPAKRFASSLQTGNGIIFNYHNKNHSLTGGKKAEVDRAFAKWCEKTDIGWTISDVVLTDSNFPGLISGSDNRNIISAQPDSEFEHPTHRAFVRISGHYSFCNTNVIYISDVDVILRNTSFNPDKADEWYNYVLHELGHAHLLYHSVEPSSNIYQEYIMYHDLTNINNLGNEQNGTLHRHPIQFDDEEGAETIFTSSTNLLASCDGISPISSIGCNGVNPVKSPSGIVSDIAVYPNPNYGNELYLSIDLEESLNFTVDILTIAGQQSIMSKDFNGILGNNIMQLPISNNLPQGSYILRVSSTKGIHTLKFIQL